MKRILLILSTPLVVLLLLTTLWSQWGQPRLESYIKNKINSLQIPGVIDSIFVKNVNFEIFPPTLKLNENDLKFRIDSTSEVSQILQVKKISIKANAFLWLIGQFRSVHVAIDGAHLKLNLDDLQSDGPAQSIPLKNLFEILQKIPVVDISLNDTWLSLFSKKNEFSIDFKNIFSKIENKDLSLQQQLIVEQIEFVSSQKKQLHGSLNALLSLNQEQLNIQNVLIKLNQSEIQAYGHFKNFSEVLLNPEFQMKTSAKIDLTELSEQINELRTDLHIPTIFGVLSSQSDLIYTNHKIQGTIEVKTENVKVDQFEIGNANIQGIFKDSIFNFPELSLRHPAGLLTLLNSSLQLDTDLSFKTTFKSDQIDLTDLFKSLQLDNIPVGMKLSANLPCDGKIKLLELQCKGVVTAKNIWVHSGMEKNASEILDVEDITANGTLMINKESVKFETQTYIKKSKGTVNGEVHFKNGFKIFYDTPELDFSNVKNLSHLNLQGLYSMKGSTEGDSSGAIFNISIDSRKTHIDKFYLGRLATELSYEKGLLHFSKINGSLERTLYMGDLSIDLSKNHLSGYIKFPQTDLLDIKDIFKNFYDIPIYIQGSGFADVEFEGPLDFWKLTSRLKAKFAKSIIGPESFDSISLNLDSPEGKINFSQAILKKNQAVIKIDGKIESPEFLDLKITGEKFRLEESEMISKISSTIVGNFNFKSTISGSIDDINLGFEGVVSDSIIDDQETPDSRFNLNIKEKILKLESMVFGDKINLNVTYPLEDHGQSKIDLVTKKWNFTSLLGIVGASNLQNEYDSNLSTSIQLTSPVNDWTQLSGSIKTSEFLLQRGNLLLKNDGLISIGADRGQMSFQNFKLSGGPNSFALIGDNWSLNDLNFKLNANLDLRLLHMFLPFLEDLSGQAEASANFSKSYDRPQILGSAKLSQAYVKVKGFPHPFEKLNADVIFSQSKIIISSLIGSLAGGQLKGDGQIEIAGVRQAPLNINATLENANFNFPDKVNSMGDAQVQLLGTWFPYELKGKYIAKHASFEKDFTDDEKVNSKRQSYFLPKLAKATSFDPLNFDLEIILPKQVSVKNSLMQGSVTGHLLLKGSVNSPLIFGKIQIEKDSKLLVKDKQFDVQTGTVTFNNTTEINPEIYLTAQSRVKEYDIQLLAQGPAKTISLKFTSQPPLPDTDIISLLALGMTSSTLEKTKTGQQQEQTNFEIGNALLSQTGFVKKLKNELNVDVQITPVYDVTGNIANRKVTFSRQLTKKIKGSFSQNMGEQNNDIKVEYIFNPQFSAVGAWENRETNTQGLTESSTNQIGKSILGLDFEFKKEFR